MEHKTIHGVGGEVHYWISRPKETSKGAIVFTHGVTADHTMFEKQVDFFEKEYTDAFNKQLNSILSDADEQHKESAGRYYESDERKLINRIKKFRNNHFRWVYDFSIPITNNLSERNLRHTKVKQKVSGQYLSIDNAKYFADIRSRRLAEGRTLFVIFTA